MFDWFIGATPEGKLTTDYGALERYESNADATVWTFVLRKGIKWHDGTEMTADDIKFSIDHYAGPTTQCTQCGAVRTNLDRTEVVDPTTVRYILFFSRTWRFCSSRMISAWWPACATGWP